MANTQYNCPPLCSRCNRLHYASQPCLTETAKVVEPPKVSVSRPYLEKRWYDSQWKKWTDWEEIEGRQLRDKYGTTPEEWKESCKSWIEIGGTYEYRIGVRTDEVVWEMSYLTQKKDD